MEEEIELLEAQDNWKKELPAQVELAYVRVPVQHIIVNGQEKVMYDRAYAIICPECKTVIQQFQVGISDIEVIKSLNTDDNELLNKTLYCSNCGQKLKIFRQMPVEVECNVYEGAM